MAFKFPDKDPDEKLDYTVDWSRYLQRDDLTIASVTWKIEKADGTAIPFSEGYSFQNDVLVLNASATANVNATTSSSTSVSVDGISGTINVGHLVTGTGITSDIYVTAVNGSTLTLSKAVSLANDTALSFTAVGLTDTLIAPPTNTTSTIVLDKGQANKTYTLICEITTSTSSKTTDTITTNRRIKLKVRERI
jgi:hypothetical protein